MFRQRMKKEHSWSEHWIKYEGQRTRNALSNPPLLIFTYLSTDLWLIDNIIQLQRMLSKRPLNASWSQTLCLSPKSSLSCSLLSLSHLKNYPYLIKAVLRFQCAHHFLPSSPFQTTSYLSLHSIITISH